MFRLKSVPVLSDTAVTFFSSIVLLTSDGSFWIVPLCYSHLEISANISIQTAVINYEKNH
jgi:hypothetical protein